MAEKFLHRMRRMIRVKHYSVRTEKAFLHWARRFILFHEKRHPRDMGAGSPLDGMLRSVGCGHRCQSACGHRRFPLSRV
jgi:hypothetical protein